MRKSAVKEHGFLGSGVFLPFVERGHVDRRKFPLLERMSFPFGKTSPLFTATHGKPELHQMDAAAAQVPFEFGCLPHEFAILIVGAESHDAFHARSVVPGTIEQHDFTARRQMLDVPLKIPLTAFRFGRFFQRNDAGTSRIQVFHEPLDGPTLAGSITAFEQDDDALTGVADP